MSVLTLDSTPLSLGAALVALAAGFDQSSLTVKDGALTYNGNAVGVFAALAAKKPSLLGASETEKKTVSEFLIAFGAADIASGLVARLEGILATSSFVSPLSFQPTAADYVAWALVRESLATADAQVKLPALSRWSRYIVASLPRTAATAAWVKVPLTSAELPAALQSRIAEMDLAAAAAADSKLRAPVAVAGAAAAKGAVAAPAKNVTAAAPAAAAAAAPAAAASASAPAAKAAAPAKAAAGEAKPKKEKAPKAAAAPAAAAGAEVPQVYRVDFRVGLIQSAIPHPTEARMFVLAVDVGAASGGVRTVVSGLAEHFKAEELVNARVVCMCNLKSGDLKGVVSAGRLMVATDAASGKKELATPPAGAVVGEPITFAAVPADKAPDAELAPKRLHEILKHLKTSAGKVVQYADNDFMTTAGPVTVQTVAEGTVA